MKSINSIAQRHKLVVARVGAEESSFPAEIKRFLLRAPSNIEIMLLELTESMRSAHIADELERVGVFYKVNKAISMYSESYPQSLMELSASERKIVNSTVAAIKRRNGNKLVFVTPVDCGRAVLLLFTPYAIPNHKTLVEKLIDGFNKLPSLSGEIWKLLAHNERVLDEGDE